MSGYVSNSRDFFIDGQMTFPNTFVQVQTQLNNYQKRLDSRLSQPKHQRRRVIGNLLEKREEYFKKFNNQGAFNNRSSWLPTKTTKGEGKRGYMTAKSLDRINRFNTVNGNQKKLLKTIEDAQDAVVNQDF